jgi:hypothetical protein
MPDLKVETDNTPSTTASSTTTTIEPTTATTIEPYTHYYTYAHEFPFDDGDHLSLRLESIQVDDNDEEEELLVDFSTPATLRTQRHAGMSKVYRAARQRRSERMLRKGGENERVRKRTKKRKREKEKVEPGEERGRSQAATTKKLLGEYFQGGEEPEDDAAPTMLPEYWQGGGSDNRHLEHHPPPIHSHQCTDCHHREPNSNPYHHRQFNHPLNPNPYRQFNPSTPQLNPNPYRQPSPRPQSHFYS